MKTKSLNELPNAKDHFSNGLFLLVDYNLMNALLNKLWELEWNWTFNLGYKITDYNPFKHLSFREIWIYLDGDSGEVTWYKKEFDARIPYFSLKFRLTLSENNVVKDPKNNDGRIECFWCSGIKTQKRGGGLYDVCPKCGK